MKVYTKKGDGGTTQLIGGKRVPKHTLKIEAYGTVDELNSYLGLIRDQEISKIHIDRILIIQERLFTVGSILAKDSNAKMELPEIYDQNITDLEIWIDDMDAYLEPMRNFVLPGGHQTVSFCHIARCVCRRAERICVNLKEEEEVNERILSYLNRLSDYLFVLGRKLSSELNAKEIPWIPVVPR